MMCYTKFGEVGTTFSHYYRGYSLPLLCICGCTKRTLKGFGAVFLLLEKFIDPINTIFEII